MKWLAPPKSALGFTLVELMVVVMILAILLTIAVPSFRQYQATQSVRSAASDLVTAMLFARSEAVKRNTDVDVSASSSWAQGWLVTAGGVTLRASGAHSGVEVDGSVSTLSYGSNGRASEAATFEIKSATDDVTPRCVRVSGTGQANNRMGACS